MAQIYDKTVNEIMTEYFSKLSMNDVFSTQDMIKYFEENYPKIKKGTITGHLMKFSTNAPSRIHCRNINNGKSDLLYKIDENKYRLYNKMTDPTVLIGYEVPSNGKPPVDFGKKDPDDENYEFAYEKDLQNFLAKNLQLIEPGLKLFEEEDINGIEFPAGNRFIDILAIDKNNDFVVIELKVSKGYDRVVGQILRYIGWVEQKMASDGQKVRGIIICKEISEDLTLACSKIKEIELFEYELSVKLNRIK
jgi:endonuclease